MVCIVETGLPSVVCVECEVGGVCGMLGVKCGVQKLECRVWSRKYKVSSGTVTVYGECV